MLSYKELERLPIWQVVTFTQDGEVVVIKDHLTSKQAGNLEVRLAMQGTLLDYETCGMPDHDHHMIAWEVRQSAKRIIKQLGEFKN